jgi:hypothetical protein
MQVKTVWQQGSKQPDNAENFAAIQQWWASLSGKEITWRQRLLPQSGEVSDLNWESQRFDEVFQVQTPEIRGITLFWRKPDSPQEHSSTPAKLELDRLRQQLYVFPQSQKDLVIQVGLPKVVYQSLEVKNPEWELNKDSNEQVLMIRDEEQKLEISIALNPESLRQLKQVLGS